jgi:hypothetical protein
MLHLVLAPVWAAAQAQFVTTLFPLWLSVFYGVAGSGVFILSLGFNGVLLLAQVGEKLPEYLPAFAGRLLAIGVPVGESQEVAAPLLGAKIQFQPLVRMTSLKSFLRHY